METYNNCIFQYLYKNMSVLFGFRTMNYACVLSLEYFKRKPLVGVHIAQLLFMSSPPPPRISRHVQTRAAGKSAFRMRRY